VAANLEPGPARQADDHAAFYEAISSARRCLKIAVQLAIAHRGMRHMVSAAGLTNLAML
jgi:hypothetical protein